MSKDAKTPKSNIRKIIHQKLYTKDSYNIEHLLRPPASRNAKLKIYNEKRDVNFSSPPKNIENKNVVDDSLTKIRRNQDISEINESIINLFHKTNYIKNKATKKLEENKEMNQVFFNRFQKFRKLEKEKAKTFYIKRNNSTNINPQSFSVFNDLVNKYKKRDGVLYTKEMFNNKDLYRETPIVTRDGDKILYFYIYNYDKFSRKTNINYDDLFKGKPIKKQIKKERIKFNKLTITKFYNKLLTSSLKRISELKKEDISNKNKFNYPYTYLGDKDIRTAQEIPRLRREVKHLNSLYNSMRKMRKTTRRTLNMIEEIKTPMDYTKNLFKKKLLKNNNDSLFEISKELQSTKRSTKMEGYYKRHKSLINSDDMKSTLSPLSNRMSFSYKEINNDRNTNNIKNKLFHSPFGKNKKGHYLIFEPSKEEKNIFSPKTKTTFYSSNSNKEKSGLLSPNNKTDQKFFEKKELKEIEKTYDGLRRMSISNKESVIKKTENFVESIGYDAEKIKKGIKIKELYNFFDRIKNVIDNYNCKQKIIALNSLIGRRISEKTNITLKKITDLDNEISGAENLYYLSLLNSKN